MTYTAAGALSTICSGTNGCSTTQETRQYNSRLQPSLMELGTSTNPTADYSLAYSYVAGGTSSCTDPQGTGDNGDIMGETLTDNYNSGYDHTTVNCYDGVNRLTQSIATGNSSYNMTYSYDQYGNMTCAPGSGGLPCTQMTYNAANNHLTAIGSATPTYDAGGNLTSDGTGTGATTYQYDAEGRVVDASTPSAGTWNSAVYDALGRMVAKSMPDGTTTRTFLFPRDLAGHWQGLFDIRPSQNWAGWDNNSMAMAGIVLQYCCGYTYMQHFNALGSTLMTTDQTGAVQREQIYGPWGQGWEYYGNWFWVRYAGMDFPGLQGNDVTPHRDYSQTMGRWLMPDPAGRAAASPANPQSWNMYAYVGDNPTSLNDPSGLFFRPWPKLPAGCTQSAYGVGLDCSGPADGDYQPFPIWFPQDANYWALVENTVMPDYAFSMTVKVAAEKAACHLAAPGGKYDTGPHAVALFQPPMTNALTGAFKMLNSNGITPTINSGYRTPADQLRMRHGASGHNPAAVVSWHQVGMAVDINGTTSTDFPFIIYTMQVHGLTWGGNFTRPDPPHFQLPSPGTSPSPAMVNACGAASGG